MSTVWAARVWFALLVAQLSSQLAWLLLADGLVNPSHGFSHPIGLAQPGFQQRYHGLLVALGWALPLLVFVWGVAAGHRRQGPDRAEAQLARWAWPALGLWSIAEVVVTPGWRTGQLAYAEAERFLALAELDHPWPCAGAMVAAGLLLTGAVRVRDPGMRFLLGSLGFWALFHAGVEATTLWAAGRILSGKTAGSSPAWLGASSLWIARSAGLLLLVAALGWVRLRPLAESASERLPISTLLSVFGLAALTLFDVARLPAVPYLAAGERLQSVARALAIPPAQGVRAEDVVPVRFAVLDAAGELTFVDVDKVYALQGARSLPDEEGDLLLIADPRCPMRRVRELVADSAAPMSLRLGQLVAPRAMIHFVRWIRITRERAAPGAAGAEPLLDLRSLPDDQLVGQLDWKQALYVARREPLLAAPPLGEARVADAVGAAHLYGL